MSNRNILRSLGAFKSRGKSRTRPNCHSTARITAVGHWYRHRQPPGHGQPYGIRVMGPICPLSGTKAK